MSTTGRPGLSRPALPVLAVLVAAGLGLSGCGGSGPAPAAASTGSAGGAPASSASASGTAAPNHPTSTPSNPSKPAVADQSAVLKTLPGSASGGCVAAGRRDSVRSGGLAITQLTGARTQWTPQRHQVRLVLVPQHADRAVRLRLTGSGPGRFTASTPRASDTEEYRYFLLTASVPAAGTWTLRATTGTDSGCWVVRID